MQSRIKFRWTKYCVFPAAGADNTSPNHNNIILTIKDTKLYTPVVTLSGKDNQKLLKLLSKGFEISVYWNEYKTKVRIKIRQRNIDNFYIQILLELIDYFF